MKQNKFLIDYKVLNTINKLELFLKIIDINSEKLS
jgi:hypothetical protein